MFHRKNTQWKVDFERNVRKNRCKDGIHAERNKIVINTIP